MADDKKNDQAKNDQAEQDQRNRDAAAAKVAQDKATQDKDQKVRNDGEVEGARSVAEAVRKVADAVIADVQSKDIGGLPDVIVSGGNKSGNQFELRGDGFSSGGIVTVNGAQAHTTDWSAQHVIGQLPVDVKDGDEVVVHIDSETRKVGHYGPQRRTLSTNAR